MQDLINSVEISIVNKNWYAALTLALTLPDIAGKIEFPDLGSNKRYSHWFNKYVGDKYKRIRAGKANRVFLSGNDCYSLRCSYLHEGKSEISQQNARDILDDFEFISPPESGSIHCNQSNNKLQLQVNIFCQDVIDGIKQWVSEVSTDSSKKIELDSFLKIFEIKDSYNFS